MSMNKKNMQYYLGLDIGTDSVGFAVTNEKYDLLKFHGKPVWGTHIFDAASLCTDKRNFRTSRRRLDRRQQRISLVQELFAPEISKVDADFFKRIKASALYREDAGYPYSIFCDSEYSDKDYYRQYPTIHHLIVELMDNKDPHDVRLVYLACAWLVAHRGHFLSNVSKENVADMKDFGKVYNEFLKFFSDNGYSEPWKIEHIEALSNEIKKKTGVINKVKGITKVIYGDNKPPKGTEEEFPFSREMMIKLLGGGTCKISELFDNEDYSEFGSVCLGYDDDKMGEIMANIGDDYNLISVMRKIYDWALLVDSLGSSQTISEAKVAVYRQHEEDLHFLKHLIRKYVPDQYNEVFRESDKDNYVAYVNHSDDATLKIKTKSAEDFSKYLTKIVKPIVPNSEEQEQYSDMIRRLELRSFLPKQKNTDNRVIPHQLYWYELSIILKNAANYLPFLSEKDSEGLSVSQKIESVFLFRIPYFVGPLNPSSPHAWLKRKEGKIYPWNFEKMVDLDMSEELFIKRMTNTCTYLPGETVIPKDSLCYQRFTVLNEINNIRINGERISVELKQRIYSDLFLRVKKVTRKKLCDYLISNGIIEKGAENAVTGIDEIKSSLSSQIAFSRLISQHIISETEAEDIIERASYAEDKHRLMRWLDKKYPSLELEDKKYICNLKISDFGRLSRMFLCELEGTENQTGEVTTVLSALWNTQNNLMELLSDKYTFVDEIREYTEDYYATHKMSLNERLDEMYISNAVKRPVYRTLDIVKEIAKVYGAPTKVFVEMTRGAAPEKKGKRTKTRKEQILELYAKCKEEDVRLLKQQLEEMGDYADSRLQGDKLFLYYMQLGKCMYTDQPISIEQLGTKLYDIDHIYPQAYVKDDSIINNKVLVLSEANGQKSDTYPISDDIRRKMHGRWRYLKEAGLISEEKYQRLTRSVPFSDEEKYGFINRQLTETSQSTKAVATLLKEMYPDTEIVYCKARLTTDFRQEFGLLKSRLFNDLHHAVDAYLNIVTGNVYNMKFSRQWFSVDSKYSLKTKTLFTHPLICKGRTVWDGEAMLSKVKATAVKNTASFTKFSYFKTGGLFDQNPVTAAEGLVPLKAGLPTEKYGGYNKPAVMFFIPVKYSAGKKTDVMIMSVEKLYGESFLKDENFAEEYAKSRIQSILGKKVDSISFPMGMRPWKVNTVLSLDGFKVCITGNSSGGRQILLQPIVSYKESAEWQLYMKKLEMFVEKNMRNSRYIYDKEYDHVSKEENCKLYEMYIKKANDSIYALRPNIPQEAIKKGKDKFASLMILDQCKTLLSIHALFTRGAASGVDLRGIDAASKAATCILSSNVSNWVNKYHNVRLIDTSPAGLWNSVSAKNILELL